MSPTCEKLLGSLSVKNGLFVERKLRVSSMYC